MIQLHQLQFGYQKPLYPVPFEATLQTGELVVLLGRNGCGKTTFLRTLGRFMAPLSGSILLQGQDTAAFSAADFARQISIVTTTRIQTPYLTVYDLIALGRQPYLGFWGRLSANDHARVEHILDQLGIAALSHHYVTDCSDGEQQLALLGRALAQDTPIILLDEATAHLDFVNKVNIFTTLQQLAHQQQKLLLFATHELALALKFADRALVFAPPQLHLEQPQVLLDQGVLQQIFGSEGLIFPFS